MSAAVDVRYEDDDNNPIATVTGVHIEATGLTVNETQTEQNIEDGVPADPITYYIRARATGVDDLISPRFQGEEFTWDDVIFPEAGTWAVSVRKDSDDSQVVAASVTVDAAS